MEATTASASQDGHRFHSLDGLRGIASVSVAFCHFVAAFGNALLTGAAVASHFPGDTWVSHTPIILLFNPELGVSIFFILSGFVLASSVTQSATPLPTLILRRWLRFAPPVVATSLFAWVVLAYTPLNIQSAAALSKSDWLTNTCAGITFSMWAFVKLIFESAFSILISTGASGRTARIFNSNLWTMPVEFLGSVGLFLTYRLLLDKTIPNRLGRLTITLLLLAVLWNTPFYGFPAGAALFELYMVLAGARLGRAWRKTPLVAGAIILFLGLVLGGTPFELNLPAGGLYVVMALWINGYIEPVSAITTMHHLGALFIVAGTLLFAPLRTVLERPAIQFLGKISFMVYLVQLPILCTVAAAIILHLAPHDGYNFATIIALLCYIFIVLLTATAFTWAVDIPAISASRRLGAVYGPRILPAAVRLLSSLKSRAGRI